MPHVAPGFSPHLVVAYCYFPSFPPSHFIVLHKSTAYLLNWARVCDSCHSAACTVYCRADSAYLCAGCDYRIHAASLVASPHERVWVCETCQRVPAVFFCKADAASLCASCDADIHSANPLAHRHHRVPIMPIPGTTLYGPPAVGGDSMMIGGSTGEGTEDDRFLSLTQDADDTTIDEEDEDEAASWLLLNPPVKNKNKNVNDNNNNLNNNYGMLFGGEVVDDYLDLAEYGGDSQFNDQYSVNQQQQHYFFPQRSYGGDSVVPVQDGQGKSLILYFQQQQQQQSHNLNFQLGMENDNSNTRYGYPASMSHSYSQVSNSSMDVSVVPESALSETSNSQPRPPKGTIDIFSGPPIQIPPQLTPMDREARVIRYREKKKNRKFEKTIRYASRKAYAETRPRIKGRFAKRTDVEAEVDQMFSTQLMADSSYRIVPSF